MKSNMSMEVLIKQIQQIQKKTKRIQEEISKTKIVGESGAGLVKITINGTYNCCNVKIDKNLLKEDIQVIEYLITSAFNDAVFRLSKIQKEKIIDISD